MSPRICRNLGTMATVFHADISKTVKTLEKAIKNIFIGKKNTKGMICKASG